MIIAGELSGEHYGAGLARSLKDLNPGIEISGVGGKEMASSGVELLFDIGSMAVVGVWEVIARLKTIYTVFSGLRQRLINNPPDLLVLIDYPDFNLFMAGIAKKRGIKILYYISPQVWAWRSGRTKKIARLVDKIAVILPFEAPIYEREGAKVEFVGHPLLETIPLSQINQVSNHSGKLVGLLPGSRHNEINFLLGPMLDAAGILYKNNPGIKFIMPVAASLDYEEIKQKVSAYGLPVELLHGQSREVMARTHLIIVASGTATLEAALIGVPMVVIYKVAWLTYNLGKMLVNTQFISLANIIAGKEVVPELIQDEANPQKIADHAGRILNDEIKAGQIRAELSKVREKLGTCGASKRVARIAMNLMNN